jgi:CDP-paratose 2-epimerase
MAQRILVTGGAGFVGTHLALALKRERADAEVIAFDNLKRRGSELALPRLRAGGVLFHHGDVRSADDLASVGAVELLVECSAEPSVHAGYGESPAYLIQTNLLGLFHCLEHLRRLGGDLLFLSTSRIYPIDPLRSLPLRQEGERLVLPETSAGPGWSCHGIAEDFPLVGHRSMYGATKLAAELLIEEYRALYGVRAIINRCGVIAGPWQMGKVDQGFVVLWLARHLYGGALTYSGFGGQGHQVRDVLHVQDLADALCRQMMNFSQFDGSIYNLGGGIERSTSLSELTRYCQLITGQTLAIGSDPSTRPADIPYYVSDSRAVCAALDWQPSCDLPALLDDIHRWLVDERTQLEPILSA